MDVAALKVTLRHGELKNLNMPPMTMVFRVQDAAQLAPLKAGDKGALSGRAGQGRLLRHTHRKGPVNGCGGKASRYKRGQHNQAP